MYVCVVVDVLDVLTSDISGIALGWIIFVTNYDQERVAFVFHCVGSCLVLTSEFPIVLCLYDSKSGCLTLRLIFGSLIVWCILGTWIGVVVDTWILVLLGLELVLSVNK